MTNDAAQHRWGLSGKGFVGNKIVVRNAELAAAIS